MVSRTAFTESSSAPALKSSNFRKPNPNKYALHCILTLKSVWIGFSTIISAMSVKPSYFSVPKPRLEVGCTAIFFCFVAAVSMLAIQDLVNHLAVIPACIWLILASAVLGSYIRENGIRRFAIDLLGLFAVNHFVEASEGTTGFQKLVSAIVCLAFGSFMSRSRSVQFIKFIGAPDNLLTWQATT